ncbi:MAG TPA: hypothetical protein V6C99_11015 [Oculatellaceae cyanobacterium]|jgi:hypothetical protein
MTLSVSFGATKPPAAQVASSPTGLRFGQKDSVNEGDQFILQRPAESFSPAERAKSALSAAVKAIFSPTKILADLAIGTLITIATAWLPGSQLVTIPVYFAISASMRAAFAAAHGWKNPKGSQTTGPQVMMMPVSTGS